ncbi:uncharacterized protein LOC121367462 [Gigantopelta aegis]|uniref:uncharacterized protein LOC121367462 n=1 Tax=Gigantopelta aegis TaxID=1735272 RepID=UPI001B889A13|nr:uncharacterized protein LOC121367462 [Gigantopelta aegis]
MPYQDGSYSSAADFLTSPEGIAVIVLVIVAIIVIIIFTVICCLLCKKKKKMKQHITTAPKQEKQSSLSFKKFENTTSPGISLISNVPPTSTTLPPITPLKEHETSARSPPPPYHISTYLSLAAPKPKEVKTAGTTSSSAAAPVIKSKQTLGKVATKKTLSATKSKHAPEPPEKAEKISLDDMSIDDIDEVSEPLPESQRARKSRSGSLFTNEPLIIEGKTFDGVGFNEDTKWRYVYNTKTGNAQWITTSDLNSLVNDGSTDDVFKTPSLKQPGGFGVRLPAVTSFRAETRDSGFTSA